MLKSIDSSPRRLYNQGGSRRVNVPWFFFAEAGLDPADPNLMVKTFIDTETKHLVVKIYPTTDT